MKEIPEEIKNRLYEFYRSAKNYVERLESHDESASREYISFIKRFIYPGAKILDLGCGTGLPSLFLNQEDYNVVGMDISEISIKKAKIRENKKLKFLCGDALNLPFKKDSFDCVASFLTFEHLPDIPQVLKQIFLVTKRNGKIIILSPNLLSPFLILLPLINKIFKRDTNFLFGETNLLKMSFLLLKNTFLLFKKKLSKGPSFTYRIPILENRFDFIPDNDACYLSCPLDFKKYFKKRKDLKIIKYQGEGRIGKIFLDFSTGIHIVIEKL